MVLDNFPTIAAARIDIGEAAHTIADAEALAASLTGEIAPGDIIVCLGAGDITAWAATLAPAIESIRNA